MLKIIILAIVQGIAEFLPISSSGHLVILGDLLGGLSEEPTLEIILHAGTLGSILVVFWRRILRMFRMRFSVADAPDGSSTLITPRLADNPVGLTTTGYPTSPAA